MYSDEHKQLLRAKRYAMEVSLKFAMRKQAEKKQKMQGTVSTSDMDGPLQTDLCIRRYHIRLYHLAIG